tara:strand:+ start:285 stop:539 length:255 start_codon:yes stop_codon:yes gene_type:complete
MYKILGNKKLEKFFYWILAIFILFAVPALTILILRLGSIFSPIGFLIKFAIYLFCGGVTLIGFFAMILFFYETIITRFNKNKKN